MIKFLLLLTFLTVPSCMKDNSFKDAKDAPEYSKTIKDKEIKSIYNKFVSLGKLHGLIFNKKVSVGFKNIQTKDVLGICTFGNNWREIDLDVDFWKSATKETRFALLFHELGHGLCTREHDFAKNKSYEDIFLNDIEYLKGFFRDKCPKSFMYPSILDDKCIKTHFNHYIKEIFDRCVPFN